MTMVRLIAWLSAKCPQNGLPVETAEDPPILTNGIKCQVLWRKLSTATSTNLLSP